jgi:repressor LexA
VHLTPRQLEVLKHIRRHIAANGFAPTLQELGDALSVSTVTVFEHVRALERKGLLRREKHKTRAIELVEDSEASSRVRHLPLMGYIAAGSPIEAVQESEDIDVTELLQIGHADDLFVLGVRGDSMVDEQIRDGDYIVVQRRDTARNGETVVALVDGGDVTLKKFYREGDRIRLQPANATMAAIYARDVQIQGIVVGVIRKY